MVDWERLVDVIESLPSGFFITDAYPSAYQSYIAIICYTHIKTHFYSQKLSLLQESIVKLQQIDEIECLLYG